MRVEKPRCPSPILSCVVALVALVHAPDARAAPELSYSSGSGSVDTFFEDCDEFGCGLYSGPLDEWSNLGEIRALESVNYYSPSTWARMPEPGWAPTGIVTSGEARVRASTASLGEDRYSNGWASLSLGFSLSEPAILALTGSVTALEITGPASSTATVDLLLSPSGGGPPLYQDSIANQPGAVAIAFEGLFPAGSYDLSFAVAAHAGAFCSGCDEDFGISVSQLAGWDLTLAVVPEPSSALLLSLSSGLIALLRRRARCK